jgi:hypothetical protein
VRITESVESDSKTEKEGFDAHILGDFTRIRVWVEGRKVII